MKKLFTEFKNFINRGNVVDMAVGVIIGGAFGKIVTSLVNNIVTPAISMITGQISFAELAVTIPAKTQGAEDIVLAYGAFIQSVVDFLIIALCVFLFVKLFSSIKKTQEKPAEERKPSEEELLLAEIRDILKEKKDS